MGTRFGSLSDLLSTVDGMVDIAAPSQSDWDWLGDVLGVERVADSEYPDRLDAAIALRDAGVAGDRVRAWVDVSPTSKPRSRQVRNSMRMATRRAWRVVSSGGVPCRVMASTNAAQSAGLMSSARRTLVTASRVVNRLMVSVVRIRVCSENSPSVCHNSSAAVTWRASWADIGGFGFAWDVDMTGR